VPKLLTIAAITAAIAIAACGDDSEDEAASAPEEASVSADQAIDEIATVRRGLDEAVSAYEDGDSQAADDAASEAYLEHFELVEGPLEEADEELNEELEHQIREELRAEIQADAPVAQVKKLVAEIDRGLDQAEAALEKAA
jgi:hypothetical protein